MKVIYYILLVTFINITVTYYSIKKVTLLYYYITLLLSKIIILCNLVTSYLKFTYEHVCRTLFLLVLHMKNIQKVILPQKVILLSYILLVKKVT